MGYGIDFYPEDSFLGGKLLVEQVRLRQDQREFSEEENEVWRKVQSSASALLPNSNAGEDGEERYLHHEQTGIRIVQIPGLLYLTVPFWNMEEWQMMLEFLRELARKIEDLSGLVGFDPAEQKLFLADQLEPPVPTDQLVEFRKRRGLSPA